MNKNVTKLIVAFIVIVLIVGIGLLIKNSNSKPQDSNAEEKKYYIELGENYRQNTSSKLKEKKKVNDLDVVSMGISYIDGKSKINIKIENNSSHESGELKIKVNLLNSKNEITHVLQGFISNIDVDDSTEINIIDENDLTNTYDYEIFVY